MIVVALAAFLYINSLLNKIDRATEPTDTLSPELIASMENETDPEDPEFTGVTIDPLEVTWDSAASHLVGVEKNLINILLIGQDRRPGEGRQRSDAMILCTINVEKKTLSMTSFLRDLYVQIPGYADNRLNAAYQFGGMTLLNKALETNFGVHIDGNVEVDFDGFEAIIDMVGGVDINLTQAETDRMNKRNKWTLSSGMEHLTGKQALYYARIRKIGTDFGRTNRQRTVLTALFNKCKTMPLDQIMEIVDECIGLVTTDMTNLEIMRYAVALVPLMMDIQIQTQHIPADGTFKYAQIRGMSVLLPDLQANRKLLVDTLSE